ncbi:hypothetical protein [Streptacidiphilus fuscans]|uniref:Uncharacterized protein n=1 Tax=Streptacidiphilus fuscans TaxID=2789292 RepID=A0A931B2R3_9ACTN|nr:hypothetical protein [Streptacidiphilus fuscans]MBF9070019.1 hypothetical protein [Streptacidiphilus fuscans]
MRFTRSVVVLSAAALAASVAAAFGPSASAATPASGSLTLTASTAFAHGAVCDGLFVSVGSPATSSWSGTTGGTAVLPVTGGDANLTQFVGSAQLGGSLTVVDVATGHSVTFSQLTFDDFAGVFSGVPQGGTAPVALLDPSGDLSVSASGGVQTFSASESDLDPAGAAYLDGALHTAFFQGGAAVGALTLSYTPAS